MLRLCSVNILKECRIMIETFGLYNITILKSIVMNDGGESKYQILFFNFIYNYISENIITLICPF